MPSRAGGGVRRQAVLSGVALRAARRVHPRAPGQLCRGRRVERGRDRRRRRRGLRSRRMPRPGRGRRGTPRRPGSRVLQATPRMARTAATCVPPRLFGARRRRDRLRRHLPRLGCGRQEACAPCGPGRACEVGKCVACAGARVQLAPPCRVRGRRRLGEPRAPPTSMETATRTSPSRVRAGASRAGRRP